MFNGRTLLLLLDFFTFGLCSMNSSSSCTCRASCDWVSPADLVLFFTRWWSVYPHWEKQGRFLVITTPVFGVTVPNRRETLFFYPFWKNKIFIFYFINNRTLLKKHVEIVRCLLMKIRQIKQRYLYKNIQQNAQIL